MYIYCFSWNNLEKNKQADTKEDALNTSAGEARPLVYGKHLFLSLQCSFLPKFSIHIETKYEDNKGSNDSVSTMAFADFHLILVVNFGQCSLSEGGTGAARSSKQATKQCSEMGDLLKPLREQRLTAAAFGSHQKLPSSPDEKGN